MKNYKEMRNKFIPKELKIIFVLESPPTSGKYFYDLHGMVSEPLFKAMMKILNLNPEVKEEGINAFRDKGFLIVDPIYLPVDKISEKEADTLIINNYPNFLLDLKEIIKNNPLVPLILIKANICRILENKLKTDGFNTLNNGLIIPFPSTGHQNKFQDKIKELLK